MSWVKFILLNAACMGVVVFSMYTQKQIFISDLYDRLMKAESAMKNDTFLFTILVLSIKTLHWNKIDLREHFGIVVSMNRSDALHMESVIH